MLVFIIISCATEQVHDQSHDTSSANLDGTETDTQESEIYQGALITSNCLFEDYTYAIDILLSCGDERFDDELRLHTFKRHSLEHAKVFNDQLLTYRNTQLWFDAYETPRCIAIRNNKLYLSTTTSQCSDFELLGEQQYLIKAVDTGQCITLGISSCDQHQSTGGRECGGIDHRYLPLVMDQCTDALEFRFATSSESCGDEYPEDECFDD